MEGKVEPEMMGKPVLTATKVSLCYADGSQKVRGVDLSLRAGEVVALLGPNGAGKTSLLRVLSGTLDPSEGTVKMLGDNIFALSAQARARQIGYLPQGGASHSPFSVEEIVLMGRFAHGGGRIFETDEDHRLVHDVLKTFELEGFRRRHLQELSGGERQRVHLARLICQQAEVLMVDEPATALDPKHQRQTMNLLCSEVRNKGLTALITLHDPNLAADFVDRMVYIVDGEIMACGTPEDMLSPEILKKVYGVDYTLMKHPEDQRPFVVPTSRGTGKY
jgi:iron complex transport system ATP-binding protein